MRLHKITLYFLYLLTLCAAVSLAVYGYRYYAQSLLERPHHVLHDMLKPSGFGGHGLGVIGAALMLMLLLYIARKYFRFMQRWGNIRHWLDFHIWMGITGPILVTFHTAFKFGGIVSVSFWSMVAVAASGFFGRFVYLQIPRRINGEELTAPELQELDGQLNQQILASIPQVDELSRRIQSLASFTTQEVDSESAKVGFWLLDTIKLRVRLRKLKRVLISETEWDRETIAKLLRSIRERRLLSRRVAFLKAAHRILHHWHLIHRPFALVMYLIFVVHVVVAALFGYTWIW